MFRHLRIWQKTPYCPSLLVVTWPKLGLSAEFLLDWIATRWKPRASQTQSPLDCESSLSVFCLPTSAKLHLCCRNGETEETNRSVAGSENSWGTEATKYPVAYATNKLRSGRLHWRDKTPPSRTSNPGARILASRAGAAGVSQSKTRSPRPSATYKTEILWWGSQRHKLFGFLSA